MKLNRKERRAMNKKGFSLIELIVVMAVMGILVLIAAPRYLGYTKDANVTAMQADAKTLSNAALQFEIKDAGHWPVVTDASGVITPVTITDDATKVDVYDAVAQAYKTATGADMTATELATLKFANFDPAKLAQLVKNTKNAQGDYILVTEGVLAGEVFYKDCLSGSDGKFNNGVFKNIVE